MTTKQKTAREILDTLESRIRSSNRDAFMPDRLPAENGEVARLARESAKDVALSDLQALLLAALPKKSRKAQRAYLTHSNDFAAVVKEKAANQAIDQSIKAIKELMK